MLLDILFFAIAGIIVFAVYKLLFKKKTTPVPQKVRLKQNISL